MYKIYVAGGWSFRREIDVITKRLGAVPGIEITSHWIGRENGRGDPQHLAECAKGDIDEVTAADAVVAIMTDKEYAYRGTFTEMGCAIGQGKPVLVVCDLVCTEDAAVSPPKYTYSHACAWNVFFHHPSVIRVPTVDAVEALLRVWTVDRNSMATRPLPRHTSEHVLPPVMVISGEHELRQWVKTMSRRREKKWTLTIRKSVGAVSVGGETAHSVELLYAENSAIDGPIAYYVGIPPREADFDLGPDVEYKRRGFFVLDEASGRLVEEK